MAASLRIALYASMAAPTLPYVMIMLRMVSAKIMPEKMIASTPRMNPGLCDLVSFWLSPLPISAKKIARAPKKTLNMTLHMITHPRIPHTKETTAKASSLLVVLLFIRNISGCVALPAPFVRIESILSRQKRKNNAVGKVCHLMEWETFCIIKGGSKL